MPRQFSLFLILIVCLLSLARPTAAELIPGTHVVIEPASEQTPRADSATSVELSDGRLLVVYQKYHAGTRAGHDEGATFTELTNAWKRPPTYRVAIAPLNRLASGRILLAFSSFLLYL